MNENATLKKISAAIKNADKILIFPHISLDGDSLGSSIALCHSLRILKKEAFILLEDEIPEYLNFLVKEEYITYNFDIFDGSYACISVDCGDEDRYPLRAKTFKNGRVKICIDHHVTNVHVQDIDYVDHSAAATGELIYYLIKNMEIEFGVKILDEVIAESIYVAIIQDTGNFSYTNTTKNTHLIAADLFDYKVNLEKIGIDLYQSVRIEKLKLSNEVMGTLEMFCDGKANFAYMTQEMLEKTGASKNEAEGFIDMLREIKNVEMSAFIKENPNGEFKISLRSKTFGDVGAIASKFGGGGHRKAAGFNAQGSLKEVIKLIKEEICEKMES